MTKFDPMDLLNSFKVLLDEDSGGIGSSGDAQRLPWLMKKYSVKMLSRVVYVLILKESSPELLNIFMDGSGWILINTWLKDAVEAHNVGHITDILTVFYIASTTKQQLKFPGPKLVKTLSETHLDQGVRSLAQQIIKKWLKVMRMREEKTSCNLKDDTTHNLVLSVPKTDPKVFLKTAHDTDFNTKIDKKMIINEKSQMKNEKNMLDTKVKDGREKPKHKPSMTASECTSNFNTKIEKNKSINEKSQMKNEKNMLNVKVKKDHNKTYDKQTTKRSNTGNISDKKNTILNYRRHSNSNSSAKKKPRLLPPSASKPALSESNSSSNKTNHSIIITNKDIANKPAVKVFRSKFQPFQPAQHQLRPPSYYPKYPQEQRSGRPEPYCKQRSPSIRPHHRRSYVQGNSPWINRSSYYYEHYRIMNNHSAYPYYQRYDRVPLCSNYEIEGFCTNRWCRYSHSR